uniref:Cullin family profile domain-containing protein n=1 Tax=Cucumis sativus TaxID=3659 RepID=A0A0A0KNJ3_CUCSA
MEESSSFFCNLGVLDSLSDDGVQEILNTYAQFSAATQALLNGIGRLSLRSEFVSHVQSLCKHGLESLVLNHFLRSLQENFEINGASEFWKHFDSYENIEILNTCDPPHSEEEVREVLCKALEEISSKKKCQEEFLSILVHALQSSRYDLMEKGRQYDAETEVIGLFAKYQLLVSSVLMATLPRHFPDLLHWYFKGKLEELSAIMAGELNEDYKFQCKDDMELDGKGRISCKSGQKDFNECYQLEKFSNIHKLVKSIGKVVLDLRNLGFTSMAEDAYASAIFSLLKAKVDSLADDDYRSSVLEPIKEWIKAVPLHFLHSLLAYLGNSAGNNSPFHSLKSSLAARASSFDSGVDTPEGLIRWQSRLEYFAYETLQDLRIAKLFEIIVDYPDSSPAIEDLKQCLEYTGQHSKLVESFISALRYRLLTAGASTNDILHQYVSTIKALRTIDSAGVFLEAVGEPIREYLRGRKDTIKCIVTMLTDGTGGNSNVSGNTGDSLLEELNRDEEGQENVGLDDDFHADDKQAWINASRWEPDPVEADPLKGGRTRRKVDILGMLVSIIGSKDQLVNEYRVMLAEKLLNKSDYDIDSEIRTLELLKIHFGESSMQKCEIMLNDLIDSKRTNSNIKATINLPSQTGMSKKKPMFSF